MRDRLLEILATSADPESVQWLRTTTADLTAEFSRRPFYYAFSGVSRHFDKHGKVTAPDLPEVDGWDEFRVARVVLLLILAEQPEETFLETFHSVLGSADIRETVAIFSALRWMPFPEQLVEPAVDGLRTNIIDVFDSIALDNPFPHVHFTEAAWNQMVLKAIFLARPLYQIEGFENRRNAALAEAISDLAHERWAAGRQITPEAWRGIIGHSYESHAEDLRRIAEGGDQRDRSAAALVIAEERRSGAKDLLGGSIEDELDEVAGGRLTWESLGKLVSEA